MAASDPMHPDLQGPPVDEMTNDEFLRRYEEVKPVLYSVCVGFGKNRGTSQVEEYMQVVLIKLWQYKHKFVHDTSFKSWACVVARNTLINHARRQARGYEVMEAIRDDDRWNPSAVPSPEACYLEKEQHREVMDWLNELTPDRRDIMILSELKEMSYKEIAEKLDIPIGTVMSRLYRARKDLGINPRKEET